MVTYPDNTDNLSYYYNIQAIIHIFKLFLFFNLNENTLCKHWLKIGGACFPRPL